MSLKLYIVSIFSTLLALLFSFQNCQKNQNVSDVKNQNSSVEGKQSIVDLSQKNITKVNFLLEDSKVIIKAGNSYQINYNKILYIDLLTGKIELSSDLDDSESGAFCMPEEQLKDLLSILSSSQICRNQPELAPGTVCGQVMKLAYAQILTGDKQYELGSATDSCGSNSIEFCEENQTALLKTYIENIKQQYKTWLCN